MVAKVKYGNLCANGHVVANDNARQKRAGGAFTCVSCENEERATRKRAAAPAVLPPAERGYHTDPDKTLPTPSRCADDAHDWLADEEARCCANCGLFQRREDVPYEYEPPTQEEPALGWADGSTCRRGHPRETHSRVYRKPDGGQQVVCITCKATAARARYVKRGYKGRPKCRHGDADRNKWGDCRICSRERAREAKRRAREATT